MDLRRLLSNFSANEIYIDLGTANTLVVDRQTGLVANEPSVISYLRTSSGPHQIVAVGVQAQRQLERTPENIVASHPLKDGVVADLDTTHAMLKYFLSKAKKPFIALRPKLVMSLPHGVIDIERKAVRECGLSAGASQVTLIEEPMAAAIGAGLPVESPRGCMIIDIGGGTTEIAVISLYDIVHCESVRIGGHAFDQAIVEHIRKTFQLAIGTQSAEVLKINIGCAVPLKSVDSHPIVGVDITTGLPRERMISSQDVYDAIAPLLMEIVEASRRSLQNISPELLSNLVEDGAVVVGGGALLRGIKQRLLHDLGIPTRIDDDPLTTIARGGYVSLRDKFLLERIAVD